MNKIFLIIYIIVFLIKTGNVFSNSIIFNVDNIQIANDNIKNREELINIAFKVGFEKLIKKILQKQDIKNLENTDLSEIKKLVSTYQIIENPKLNLDKITIVNITFDHVKINNFFYNKNIPYADISKSSIILLPVLVEEDNVFMFSKNYFYNNWNTNKIKNIDEGFIEYIMPLENLETIELLNKNKYNLENIDIKEILSSYNIKDYIFAVIKISDDETKVFLKGLLSEKETVKNLIYKDSVLDQDNKFQDITQKIKNEISEMWKAQNLIDVRTPSYLNIRLNFEEQRDLLNLQDALGKISLIENYRVIELNKNYAKIKIKYLGKIDKIKNKFTNQGIKIDVINNQWVLKLI